LKKKKSPWRVASGRRNPSRSDHVAGWRYGCSVKVPTILRTYTGGRRLSRLPATRSTRCSSTSTPVMGLRGRLISETVAAPLRQHLHQQRRRPLPRCARRPAQGRRHRHDPSCRRRWLAGVRFGPCRLTTPRIVRFDSLVDSVGHTPLVGLPHLSPSADVRLWAKLEQNNPTVRSRTVPRCGWSRRAEKEGVFTPVRRCSSRRPAIPASRWRWSAPSAAIGWCASCGEHVGGASPAAADVGRRDRLLAFRGRQQ